MRQRRVHEMAQLGHTFGGILRVSKQIRPLVSMFGWKMGVTKRTLGGSKGYLHQHMLVWTSDASARRDGNTTYLSGIVTTSRKKPPSYGLSGGPSSSAHVLVVREARTFSTECAFRTNNQSPDVPIAGPEDDPCSQ